MLTHLSPEDRKHICLAHPYIFSTEQSPWEVTKPYSVFCTPADKVSTQVFLSLIVACSEQSEEPSLAQWNPSFLDFQLSGYLSLLTTLFCLHLLFRPVHRIFYFTVKSDMILFSSHFGPISIPTVPLVRSGAIFFWLNTKHIKDVK